MASPAGALDLEEEEKGVVGLHRLFRFADGADAVLMAAGAAGAVASGVAQPLMTLVFGEVVDAFGSGSRHDVLRRVSGVRLESRSPFNCSSYAANLPFLVCSLEWIDRYNAKGEVGEYLLMYSEFSSFLTIPCSASSQVGSQKSTWLNFCNSCSTILNF